MNITDLVSLAPWIVVLVVFMGMAGLHWRLISALDQALARSTTPVPPIHLPTSPPVAPPLPVQGKPLPLPQLPPVVPASPPVAHPPQPAPTGPFAGAPTWFQWGLHEIGFHETGNNQGIERYIGLAHAGTPGDPWCAIFMNAALESCGVVGSRSPSSQSFRTNPNFVQITTPALGAIVVFWRGTPSSGLGHVGMYRGEDPNEVWVLGGNESDMVQIEALPKTSASFGLIGYWWPKSVPLPRTGVVIMPTGSPTQVQLPPAGLAPVAPGPAPTPVPANQRGIVATMFAGQQSAYGPPIDDTQAGVALPFHFQGIRPRVRVTKGGTSVDCDIVDVGPWNTNDPYWETGMRPQAEGGVDTTGRKTNKAGIDLTLAAASAIQLDGKGLVDWSFINPTLDAVERALQPTVT